MTGRANGPRLPTSSITPMHIAAVEALDQHPALRFLDAARGQTVDAAVVAAYEEETSEHRPFDLKDQLDEPDPDNCPQCWRPTFILHGWDAFGGTASPGWCVACGYQRSEDEAHDLSIDQAMRRHMDD